MQAALIAAKAAKFGQAPPGYWDSDSLHATPQRHHIGTFRRLLRDELMAVSEQAAQDDVEKVRVCDATPPSSSSHASTLTIVPRRASPRRPVQEKTQIEGRVPDAPQAADARRTRRAKEAGGPRASARQSLKKYLRRKSEALKPKVEAAKKCAGCSLEVFDEAVICGGTCA